MNSAFVFYFTRLLQVRMIHRSIESERLTTEVTPGRSNQGGRLGVTAVLLCLLSPAFRLLSKVPAGGNASTVATPACMLRSEITLVVSSDVPLPLSQQ